MCPILSTAQSVLDLSLCQTSAIEHLLNLLVKHSATLYLMQCLSVRQCSCYNVSVLASWDKYK